VLLVQLQEFESPREIFSDYAYFPRTPRPGSIIAHEYNAVHVRRFGYGAGSQVIEIASNDGYCCSTQGEGRSVLGIEPAENVAAVAARRHSDAHVLFRCAERRGTEGQGRSGRLLLGNNVLAHVRR